MVYLRRVNARAGRGHLAIRLGLQRRRWRFRRATSPARFILLPGVSHFAPLQRPDQFNAALLAFLASVLP